MDDLHTTFLLGASFLPDCEVLMTTYTFRLIGLAMTDWPQLIQWGMS